MGRVTRPPHSSTLVGWREWVSLPDLGVAWVKAKLDTGARSSSLHALDVTTFEQDGSPWVRFAVQPWQVSDGSLVATQVPVHDVRPIRSSSGHVEERIVILTGIRILDRTITAEVTLTNRDVMGFRMLIGREALRQGFVVDSRRSYVSTRPSLATRRTNRGR
jgi:hypothetical protein